jgi:hypothetical protein
MDAQPSAARISLPGGAARKVSAPVRRACIPDTSAASGPRTGNLEGPRPRRRSSRGSEGPEQACLPGNRGYATRAGCPVSTTSRRYDLRRTCRLVTSRSHRPRSTWPNQAPPPLPAVRHRYKRARCLWLEQFQIADSGPRTAASPVCVTARRFTSYGRLLSSGWRVVRCGGASLVAASGWCCDWHPVFPGLGYGAVVPDVLSLLKMPVAGGTFPRWGKSRPLWWSAVRSLHIFCARLLSLSMP